MRALIVEDDKALARTLGEMLKSIHFESDISYDGESGLDNGLSGVYDLIVLDIMLPKKDGFSVARELRREKIDTPILMLTARTETGDRVRGLDSGGDYYLTKPFEMSELLACVRALTRRQGEVVMDELSFGDLKLKEHILLHHDDTKAVNTEDAPDNVRPHAVSAAFEDGLLHADLAPLSWNVLRLKAQ